MLAVKISRFYIGIIVLITAGLTIATEVLIRLAGSTAPEMGRLEVRINGTWGTVHSSDWGKLDADVVCRQLGYSVPVVYTPLVGYFGQGIAMPVHMAHVNCFGNESTIFDCQYKKPMDETHENDVGIMCKPKETADYHVRLKDGTSVNSGRVEIYLGGTWGSICDRNWNLNDATVVCRNLGFAAADAYHQVENVGDSSQIHLHDVACLGTESGLRYCQHLVYNETTATACNGGRDVGVTCLSMKDFQIRLVGSNSPNEGRVEVLLSNVWSPILNLDVEWELSEGDVVCKVLGFETAYAAVTDGRFGDGESGQYSMLDVKCVGNESRIEECVYEVANRDSIDQEESPLGVVCGSKNANDGDVRLVGGENANEGRLEIHNFGKWGSICVDGWSPGAVNVACTQMGYSSGNSTIDPIPGPNGQAIHLEGVVCSGIEASLSECRHGDWEIHNCSHSQDVTISCTRNEDFDVRLTGGQVASEGRPEVFFNHAWGAMCAKDLTIADAQVVCRSLGFSSEEVDFCGYIGSVHSRFYKIQLHCLGSEANIKNCSFAMVGRQKCDTSACIRCSRKYEDKQMRLIGGKTVNEGIPGVYNAGTGQFDLVCDHNITHYDKNVICRSMGFSSTKINYHLPESIPTTNSSASHEYDCFVENVACRGTEIDVRDCPTDPEAVPENHGVKVAYIYCDDVTEHSVRLVGGASAREGRMEIYHQGEWGTVCSSAWSTADTVVACRSLGLAPPPLNSTTLSSAPGIGTIHLTNVACTGSEDGIADCEHSDWGINKCSHESDVMLRCSVQLHNWCGTIFCEEGEICQLGLSFEFYCQTEQESSNMYLAFILPILTFFVILAIYITMRLCQTLPVQPHKDCLNLIRRCCGKKASNYRIILTASDEIILVENAS